VAEIKIRSLSKHFKKASGFSVHALQDVNMTVREGSFVAIVGRSGCGKTTLMDIICGIQRPSEGEVLFDDQPLDSATAQIGYVTQRDTLLPWRNARKNIALPLEVQHMSRAAREQKVDELLELTNLENFGSHYPAELSGGMRQRIALARSLAYEPATLLMDEPFGALDAITRLELQTEFLKIWDSRQLTAVFVTHDLGEAVALADEVIVMSPNPGRISERITIDIPRPRDLRTIQAEPSYGEHFRQTAEALSIAVHEPAVGLAEPA
jgi:NitT/TauT family transport system ATP-binding protein